MIPYEKYRGLRDELNSMQLALDEDPAAIGVGNINKKISQINALKERAAAILGQTIANKYDREKTYKELKLDYDLKFQKLLNADDTIKTLKSETLRTAACNSNLSEEFLKQNAAEIDFNDAEGLFKFAQNRFSTLESVNTNLSRQISVVELQLELGEIERATGNPWRTRTVKPVGA